jgi:hypothetical protein
MNTLGMQNPDFSPLSPEASGKGAASDVPRAEVVVPPDVSGVRFHV